MKKPPPFKSLKSSFSESFISSGKQEGGAIVLGEGHHNVTRGTCVSASLNINNLGKAAELHLSFSLSSGAVPVPNLSLQNIEYYCAYAFNCVFPTLLPTREESSTVFV
jgi:hypothetical protein